MAQPIRPLPIVALATSDIAPERATAPTNAKLFERALAKLQTLAPNDDFSAVGDIRTSNPIALRSVSNTSLWTEIIESNAIGPGRRARPDIFSAFIRANKPL